VSPDGAKRRDSGARGVAGYGPTVHDLPAEILEALPLGVLVHREGVVRYVNPALCALVGRDRAAVVGQPFGGLLVAEDAARLQERFARRMRGEMVPSAYGAMVALPDGTRRSVDLEVRRSGDDVVVLVRDVTELAEARARRMSLAHLGVSLQLRHTEEAVLAALREGLEAAALWALWLDPTDAGPAARFVDFPPPLHRAWLAAFERNGCGRVGYWSRFTQEAFGWGESYADDGLDALAQWIGADAAKGLGLESLGLVRAVAVRVDVTDGVRPLLVLLGPWLAEDDLPMARLLAAQVGAALDNARVLLAARRHARDLEAVNGVARRMLEVAPEGPSPVLQTACAAMRLGLRARSVTVLLGNAAGDVLTRVPSGPHEPIGPVADRVVVADALCVREALGTGEVVVVGDSGTDPRAAGIVADGAEAQTLLLLPWVVRAQTRGLLVVADNPARRFQDDEVALARTIASVVPVGVDNAELYAETRKRVEELATTQARLVQRERLAALGELAAVMAHEVRNPLAVIFNALVSLRRRVGDDAEAGMFLAILREEAERLNRIVGDLLDFARPVRIELSTVSGARLLEEALAATIAASGDSAPVVTWSVDPEAPELCCDPRRVRHALVNVLTNALQATAGLGPIRLGVRRGEGAARAGKVGLSVRDAGPGIAPADLARVLEPFYTTKSTGTGLGLAVVKRIVDEHDGALDIDSAPGLGATFTVWLSAADASTAASGPPFVDEGSGI